MVDRGVDVLNHVELSQQVREAASVLSVNDEIQSDDDWYAIYRF